MTRMKPMRKAKMAKAVGLPKSWKRLAVMAKLDQAATSTAAGRTSAQPALSALSSGAS